MTTGTNDEIVVVKVYDDIGAATSAKDKLETAGIKAVIDDMNVAGMTPTEGIEVRVFSKDLDKAALLLQE